MKPLARLQSSRLKSPAQSGWSWGLIGCIDLPRSATSSFFNGDDCIRLLGGREMSAAATKAK